MKSAEEIGKATLERLAAQAALNREKGARREVFALLDQEPNLRPAQILGKLSRPLKLRRAQELRKEWRAESSASRSKLNQDGTHGTQRENPTAARAAAFIRD